MNYSEEKRPPDCLVFICNCKHIPLKKLCELTALKLLGARSFRMPTIYLSLNCPKRFAIFVHTFILKPLLYLLYLKSNSLTVLNHIYSRDPPSDHSNKETTSRKDHFLVRTEYFYFMFEFASLIRPVSL